MSEKLKNTKIFFLVSTLIAFAAMGVYIYKNAQSFKDILNVSVFNIFVFTLLQLFLLSINAMILLVYMKMFKNKISFLDCFGLSSLNSFFNSIFVRGGTVVRGYYLKKRHGLLYTDFILSLASFTLIEIMMAGLIGVLMLLGIYFRTGSMNAWLMLFFILILAACYLVIVFPLDAMLKRKDVWVIKKISDVAVSWKRMVSHRSTMMWLFLLGFLNIFIFALRLQYAFHILHERTALTDCLLIAATGTIANMFAVTPGALGIREFLIGATYKLVNGKVLQAVVATVLDRAVSVVIVLFLSAFFLLYFLSKTKRSSYESKDIHIKL